MNKIIWKGDRFECGNPELEDAKCEALRGDNKRLHEFMAACDLPMDGYSYDAEWNIEIHRKTEQGKLALFPIADEGTGFNICFHLGAYAIASINLGQKLEICAYSFKPLLHPVLFAGLSNWFGDRKAEEIDKNCSYYSGDSILKCAVNPSLPCKDCSDVSAGFNENLFVWRATNLGGLAEAFDRLQDFGGGRSFNEMRQAFIAAQDSERSLSEIRIPRFDIGVDLGSGQDATAIATGITAEDGSVRINSLEIHADTSGIEGAIARTRELISRSTMLPERLLYGEGQSVADHSLEAYQCGLSDRIAPLPPRLEEVGREYEEDARRRRIWSQYAGMPIHPRPQSCLAPRFLYGVLEDAEVNLSSQLGLSPEEVAEHKANGTLFAELHGRSQLEKFNRINND